MDDVSCIGSERALINCSYDRSTVDCSHYEDAGVRCQCKWLVITVTGDLILSILNPKTPAGWLSKYRVHISRPHYPYI